MRQSAAKVVANKSASMRVTAGEVGFEFGCDCEIRHQIGVTVTRL
jgi:hypothetical protein